VRRLHSSPAAALHSNCQTSRDSSLLLPPEEATTAAAEAAVAAEAVLIDDPAALYVPAYSSLFNLIPFKSHTIRFRTNNVNAVTVV